MDLHPGSSGAPGERAVTIVREGFGLIGLQSAWTKAQIAQGAIQFRLARYTAAEARLLDEDPTRTVLPALGSRDVSPDEKG